jgi:hypothetical protein
MKRPLIYGIIATVFGILSLSASIATHNVLGGGGFGLAAGLMGLAAGMAGNHHGD